MRIARRATVLRSRRIVVRRCCRLRLKQPEEHADLVCADKTDVVHLRKREVEDLRVRTVRRVQEEARVLLVWRQHVRIVERLAPCTAIAPAQLLGDLLDEAGGRGGIASHRHAELVLARPHDEDPQVDAQPRWVAMQHERVGLFDQLDLARRGEARRGAVQREDLRRGREAERGVDGPEVHVEDEREALCLGSVATGLRVVPLPVDADARRGRRHGLQRRTRPGRSHLGCGQPIDDHPERVRDDGARAAGLLAPRVHLILADGALVDHERAATLRHDRRPEVLDLRARVRPDGNEPALARIEPNVVADERHGGVAARPRRVDRRVPRLVGHGEVVERGAAVVRLGNDQVDQLRRGLRSELVERAADDAVRGDDDLRVEVLHVRRQRPRRAAAGRTGLVVQVAPPFSDCA